MTLFTDEELKLEKEDAILNGYERRLALIHRLELAEKAVEIARQVQTSLPKPMSWKYFHLAWNVWSKAAGK